MQKTARSRGGGAVETVQPWKARLVRQPADLTFLIEYFEVSREAARHKLVTPSQAARP